MAKMHEAINELLPEEQTQVRLSASCVNQCEWTCVSVPHRCLSSLQMLFLRINASFKLHLKRQLARLGVSNDGGPQHG